MTWLRSDRQLEQELSKCSCINSTDCAQKSLLSFKIALHGFIAKCFCIPTETGLDPVVKTGVLAEVQAEYAQLREERLSGVSGSRA